jgi:ribosomal protein L11 methyltransferase
VAAAVGPLVGGVELRDPGTLLATAPGRTTVVALCAPPERSAVLSAAAAALAQARSTGLAVDPVVVRERCADESEWRDVWKQFFRATRMGRRFVVRPSWDPVAVATGELIIDLDPGRAFGTGAHPSTRLAVALAEDVADACAAGAAQRPHGGPLAIARFLDLGCGSGILSIAAARLWPGATGLALDVDPEATACSQENLERNDVKTVAVHTGTIEQPPSARDGLAGLDRFDLIMANIQADVLLELAGRMAARLRPRGYAILSGILCSQADELAGHYRRVGFELKARRDEDEWSALLLVAP